MLWLMTTMMLQQVTPLTCPHLQGKKRALARRDVMRLHATPIFELSKSQRQADGSKLTSAKSMELLKQCEKSLTRIGELEVGLEVLSDEELRSRLRSEADSIEGVFAVVREAAWRVLSLRAYDVQMLGGLVMAKGGLAEMATGEGKTLAAVAPVVFHALKGKGALVVTTNDYLARRDADSVGQVCRFLGLSVGLVESTSTRDERRLAYRCDVTYVSNSEVGFDYLRDHLAFAADDVVLRDDGKVAFCLVDEADSILIDEARTPLVVSEQIEAAVDKFEVARELADMLQPGVHYDVDRKRSVVTLTERGYGESLQVLGVRDLADAANAWAPFVTNALRAKELLERDRDYIIRGDNEVAIVDTFSGRVLEGRRWSDGLQQAVETKERLGHVSNVTRAAATVTFQSLFGRQVLCDILAGMTGTALTDADEFESVYGLIVAPVPTALPVARRDYDDAVYATLEAKWRAAAAEVARVHKSGQPILVGTSSIDDSEDFATRLRETYGLQVQTLHARPDTAAYEADVVARAGRLGGITVATNMAGRGTDIVLGGDPKFYVKRYLERILTGADTMNDHVVPDEARALLDRAAHNAVSSLSSESDSLSTDEAAQVAAASVESLKGAKVLAELRSAARAAREKTAASLADERARVLELGGLYVVGTQRHESRRIDRQLRGRSGRQGDPGVSRFFVSVEDEMFKLFGGDTVKNMMRTLRVGEDLPIESKTVTEALARVQKQVEKRNADIRSTTLSFDEVLDKQRRQIYAWRAKLLMADDQAIKMICMAWTAATAAAVIDSVKRDSQPNVGESAVELLRSRLNQVFVASSIPHLPDESLENLLNAQSFLDDADEDNEAAVSRALSLIGIDLETSFERIAKLRKQRTPSQAFTALALLRIDKLWADHITKISDLREAVQFRAYQGTQPLQEFQRDAFILYGKLRTKIKSDTTYSFFQLLLTSH